MSALAIGLLIFVLPPLAVAAYVAAVVVGELRTPRVPILMYHRFLRAADLRSGAVVDDEQVWVVVDDELDDQCRALVAAGYQSIDLDELLDGFHGRRPLPPKPIVLTFDDGYLSCATIAQPILEKHGFKGVFYIALDPDAHTRELVVGKDDWLSPAQIVELHRRGHTVASHTVTHGLLSEMDDDQVRWELTESKVRLEAMIGAEVRHFCIPRAGGNRRIVAMVGEAGYLTSSGADKGTANPRRSPLRLPRIGVARATSGEILLRRLEPLRAARERILADIRLVPTRLLGPRVGYNLRQVLYGGPLRRALLQQRLGAVLAALAALYLALGVAWLWHVVQA